MTTVQTKAEITPETKDALIQARLQVVEPRITLRKTIANTLTMGYRGVLKIKHNPEDLADVVLMPIIFTVMFAYIFGGAVSGDVKAYLPLLIPGILTQTVLFGSLATGVQLRDDIDKGVFDRFKSLPISGMAPLTGALVANTFRYVVAITITLAVGFIMGYRPGGGLGGVLAASIMVITCAFALSWLFAFLGVLIDSPTGVQGIAVITLLPLTFLSNAFVPIDTLPSWLEAFARVNPVTRIVSSFRELANDGVASSETAWALLTALLIAAIMAPIAIYMYKRRT